MLAAAIIVFREVLEAALVAGIVLAATRGIAGSRAWIAGGAGLGLVGAMALAAFADVLTDAFAGSGQEVFNAAILALAVLMLAWHNCWMARHGREMAVEMKAVGDAVSSGERPLWMLAVVVGVAVLREGAETVLFLTGIAADGHQTAVDTALGAVAGLAGGGVMGAVLYLGLLAVPTRALFRVTSTLVTLLAAGMAAQAANLLIAAGWLNIGTRPLWDSSPLLAQDSLAGRLLHTLIGYVDRPSPSQLAAWAVTVLAITALTRRLAPARPVVTQGSESRLTRLTRQVLLRG